MNVTGIRMWKQLTAHCDPASDYEKMRAENGRNEINKNKDKNCVWIKQKIYYFAMFWHHLALSVDKNCHIMSLTMEMECNCEWD